MFVNWLSRRVPTFHTEVSILSIIESGNSSIESENSNIDSENSSIEFENSSIESENSILLFFRLDTHIPHKRYII